MQQQKYKLNDPFFNEFVFNLIVNAPQELKVKLPIQLIKYTTSVEKIKWFADKASLEKKLQMISILGGAFSLTVHPPKYFDKAKLQDILNNFNEGKRLEDVDSMIQEKVFTFTNREVMAIHTIMAMNCHSDTYMLNRDYAMIATQIAQGKINTKIRDVELLKEVMQDQKLLCKLILYNLRDQNIVDGMTGFKVRELMILLYLFLNRNKHVAIKEIQDFFASIYSPTVVSSSLYAMCETFHVERFPNSYKYSIAGLGIQVIGNYINRLINLTLSF